jgi:uncharacterized RDD family membrane protein YckC
VTLKDQVCGACGARFGLDAPSCPRCGQDTSRDHVYAFGAWWERLLATWIDLIAVGLVVGLPTGAILSMAGVASANRSDALGWTVFGAIFVYWVVFEALKATTLGKLVFRLRVLNEGEHHIALWQSVVRNVFKMIGLGGSLITLLFILFSRRSQRLGDMAAATIVVKDVTKRLARRQAGYLAC